MERRLGLQQTLEQSLTIVLPVLFSIGNGIHVKEHVNQAWDAAGSDVVPPPPTQLAPRTA
jgi:hypothetical protein